MTYHTPFSSRRNLRTFVASLLAYVLLTSQLAPMAMGFNTLANDRAPASKRDVTEKSAAPPQANAANSFAPVPVPLRVTTAGMVPIISATKVDSFSDPDMDGKVSPGQTITYSVTITNSGPDPALNVTLNDTVDSNTTIVPGSATSTPIATDETYDVLGNVRIQPNAAGGLLANDVNPNTGNNSGLTSSGPTTGPTNGQATVNADGSFSYNPDPGFTGTDSFTYTVTSSGGTDTGTVTLNVTGMIWFVNSAATPGGDGRLISPFNCLVGPACFDPVAVDDLGDNIFLYTGAYSDAGSLTLLNNQKVIGQGTSSGTTLEAAAGVTLPPHSDALPALNGNPGSVTVNSAASGIVVTSGNSNTLRGFTLGNNGSGAKIFSTAFGTLTISEVALSGAGTALNLDSGTLAATFTSIASTTAAGQGIVLDQVAGSLTSTAGTIITDPATQGILITASMADINFGNTAVSDATDAISLQNNSAGTRTFGTITTTGGTGVGFLHSNGGGAVIVTGATSITNPGGNGIDIDGSNANLSFAATTVNKGSTGNIGVDLTNNATRTITFSSLAVSTTNAFALNTNNSGTVNVTNAAGSSLTQNGAGGGAASLTNTALGLNFTSISSTNGGNGIIISGVSGTFNSGTTNLQNNAGAGLLMSGSSVVANFGTTTVNSSAGAAVVISGQTGNVSFGDLDLTPDANNRGLDVSSTTGTITSTSGDIATTSAAAINISGPAGRTPLAMVLTNVDSTNSTTEGIFLNLVSGNLTVNDAGTATNIQNSTGTGIQVQSTGAGTINFGNTTVNSSGNGNGDDTGTGVFLNNNAGAITFGALTVTPDSGERGLFATDNDATVAGAITVGSGTITTTNDTAIEITGQANGNRTPLNIQLTTINTTGGAVAANGIRLVNTSATGSPGGFRILGSGGSCTVATPTCTGGQISNTTGGDGATGGSGIRLDNADTVVLTRMRINDHPNYGIRGVNVNGFTLNTSVVNGANGTNPGSPFSEGSIIFDGTGASPAQGLVGSASITNSDIRGGRSDNLRIDNDQGTLNLTVTGTTFRDTFDQSDANDNVFIELGNTATGFVSITGSTFGETSGDHIQANMINTAVGHFTITGNTFTGTGSTKPSRLGMGILIAGGAWTGTCRYNISNNIMSGTRQGGAIHTNKGGPGGGTMEGIISGNTIGVAATAESGASESTGIIVASRGNAGIHRTLVSGNAIHQVDEFGINIEVGEDGGVPDNTNPGATSGPAAGMQATVTGNTIDTPGPNALHGIQINSGVQVGDNNLTCADIGGAGALSNNVPTAANEGAGGADIRPRQRNASRVELPGYGSTAFNNAQVQIYLAGRNNTTTVTSSSSNATGTANDGYFNTTPAGSACAQPTAPTLPSAPATAGPETIGASTSGSLPSMAARAGEMIPASHANVESNSLSFSAKQVGGSAFRYAAAGTSAPLGQQQTRGSQDKQTKGGGGKPAPPSTTGNSPQQTGGPTKPTAQTPTTGVVVDPGVRFAPKPRLAELPPVIVGDNLTWNVGTLPAGGSVTITFQVVVDNPFTGVMAQVSNQGTVTADGGITVLTDDPSVGGMNDPTVTPVAVPPDLFVRDASVADPASGSTSMIFTLALSAPATMGGITANVSTADGTATGGTCAGGNDYESVSGGLVTFNAGDQIKTFPVTVCSDAAAEGDEAFTLNVNSAPGAVIADGTGTGTITANVPGTIIISELRTSGPGGEGDDFVEIYNNTDAPHTVPAAGYGLFKRGASCDTLPVLIGTIPAATVIPQRGHYLFTGSAYSLTNYGGTGAAAGDQTLAADLESDFNVGLFSTVDPLAISTANRLDAVGFGISTGGVCDLLLEGTTLPPASGSDSQYSFVREFTLVSNNVPTPTDANDNATDFTVVSTSGTSIGGNVATLGAPGPENLASPPLKKFTQVGAFFLDQTKAASAEPNRHRDLTVVPNGALGTLSSRRRFVNNTGGPITRLRFRIYDITTFPAPTGTADLRALSSVSVSVGPVADPVTCAAAGMSLPCTVTVLGTTLETPPSQPNAGGLNSTMSAGTVTMATPIADGASINLQFLFGIQQSGSFRVFVFVEALP